MLTITLLRLTCTAGLSLVPLLVVARGQGFLPLLSIAQKLLTAVLISGDGHSKVHISKSQNIINTNQRYRGLLDISQVFVSRLDYAFEWV